MTARPTGDLLGAAALLAAMIALLYSLWYPEIGAALGAEKARQRADRDPVIRRVADALRVKAVPLVLVSAIQLVVFAPDVVGIVEHALSLVTSERAASFATYDSVQAAFLAVYLLSAILAAIALRQAFDVWRRLQDLRRD